jgi:integrase
MASISNDGGRRRIQFFLPNDDNRRTIRLGKVSQRQAEEFAGYVEKLIGEKITGAAVDEKVSRWVADLPDEMHTKLAALGLVKSRIEPKTTGLGTFIDEFLARMETTAKPRTIINIGQVRAWLVKYFGEGRDVRTITTADAEDFRAFMAIGHREGEMGKGLGENTARRHIGRCRQIFKAAIRRGIIRGSNPFDGIASTVRGDKSRQFNVTREMADALIAACPSTEWKLLVALSRYGGLRIPSEALPLKWADINWEKNSILVTSPKTEHHEGKGSRLIPLFPELRKPLLDVFAEAREGEVYVITRHRGEAVNLRTHILRIIGKAGLKAWPKPWHNMRATRQTELAERYPLHVVCAWIGNTRAVAQEHYLQVTDEHFRLASGAADAIDYKRDEAAQNAAHKPRLGASNGGQSENPKVQNDSENPVLCGAGTDGGYPRQDSNLRPPV